MRESQAGSQQSRRGGPRASPLLAMLVLGGRGRRDTTQASRSRRHHTCGATIVQGQRAQARHFNELTTGWGRHPVVGRSSAQAQDGREDRRSSLAYFAQLTDFQLADEESPARVEFADAGASSAWRPQEALPPVRHRPEHEAAQRAAHAARSRQGDGERADDGARRPDRRPGRQPAVQRDAVGAPADRAGLEAGPEQRRCEDFSDRRATRPRAALAPAGPTTPEPNYVGVQDYEEFTRNEDYYDPDEPAGDFVNWPTYRGPDGRGPGAVQDHRPRRSPRTWSTATTTALVQGNEDANQVFEHIATGCFKVDRDQRPRRLAAEPGGAGPRRTSTAVPVPPAGSECVPPDPDRRFVSKGEVRAHLRATATRTTTTASSFVDQDEDERPRRHRLVLRLEPEARAALHRRSTRSPRAASCRTPRRATSTTPSSSGWRTSSSRRTEAKSKLIVVFGHHPIRSLELAGRRRERARRAAAATTTSGDYAGPDRDPAPGPQPRAQPGLRPRPARVDAAAPGRDDHRRGLEDCWSASRNVIAYVPGHTHENRVDAVPDARSPTTRGRASGS